MEVYIEYAFLQNFIIDALLLWLALNISKQPISYKRIALSALCGAAFALLFPLLNLSKVFAFFLKFSFGFLLCLLATKPKNAGGMVALSFVFFFGLTFLFGGALIALYQIFELDHSIENGYIVESAPLSLVLCGIIVLAVFTLKWAKKLYFDRKIRRFYYSCELFSQTKCIKAVGFLDSGNLASFHSIPVCFLSPEMVFELIDTGQVFDEMQISTLNGVKKIKIFKGPILKIYFENSEHIVKELYFSSEPSLKGRNYQMILSPLLFDNKN